MNEFKTATKRISYSRSGRLAYKSSLESAKRDRQSSRERARSASERELDLFPLLEMESSDVILARTFQGAKFKLSTQCILDISVISTHLWKRRQLHWKTFSMRFKTLGMFPNETKIRWKSFKNWANAFAKHFSNVDNAFEQWKDKSFSLSAPRNDSIVLHTVHAKILFTFWWLQKLCRFASRRFLKCFTSNVRVIIIMPATASAATAIINFKMKALHSMTCRVLSWRENLENNIQCIGSNGFPIIYRTKFGR